MSLFFCAYIHGTKEQRYANDSYYLTSPLRCTNAIGIDIDNTAGAFNKNTAAVNETFDR